MSLLVPERSKEKFVLTMARLTSTTIGTVNTINCMTTILAAISKHFIVCSAMCERKLKIISRNDKYQPFCFSIHHPDGVTRSTRICHHTDVGRKSFGEFISFSTDDRYIGLVQTFSDTVVHDSLIEKDGCVNIKRIKMFFHSVD